MFAVLFAALLAEASAHFLPDAMQGSWVPTTIPQSILGPLSTGVGILQTFEATNHKNGESHMSLLVGQIFRVGTQGFMQYCFTTPGSLMPPLPGYGMVSEQAPFIVDSHSEEHVDFCWRNSTTLPRLPTHKENCFGCECAKITIKLTGKDTLQLTLWQSPPIVHVHVELKRKGPAPPKAFYDAIVGLGRCEFQNKTGALPRTAGADLQREASNQKDVLHASLHAKADMSKQSLCPLMPNLIKDQKLAETKHEAETNNASGLPIPYCAQLNGANHLLDPKRVPDVRIQYRKPMAPCYPCYVKYSVSAALADDEYIALGFGGLNYFMGLLPKVIAGGWTMGTERHQYFGMATDARTVDGLMDGEATSDAIAVGYVSGGKSCFREMRALSYTGAPVDVAEGSKVLENTAVERFNGRVVLRFKLKQYWGKTPPKIEIMASMIKHMWAIGKISDAPAPTPTPPAGRYVCKTCGHIYDPTADGGGLAFEDLPDGWVCPVCGEPKSVYEPLASDDDSKSWLHDRKFRHHNGSLSSKEVGSQCEDTLGFHGARRGSTPEFWFAQNIPCVFHPKEWGMLDMGEEVEDIISV